jgi:hypothetical protein
VAGLVHRGEVVFSQDDVARHGGVAAVEILRRSGGLKGYADGGPVGRAPYVMPNAAAMRPANDSAPPINFITPPGVALERDGPPKRRADGGYDQAIRVVEGGLGQRMARGQGPFRGVSGAGYRNG